MVSRMPPTSPAAIMLQNSVSKVVGYFFSASAKVEPDYT
jgi:hypothetical protein